MPKPQGLHHISNYSCHMDDDLVRQRHETNDSTKVKGKFN